MDMKLGLGTINGVHSKISIIERKELEKYLTQLIYNTNQ